MKRVNWILIGASSLALLNGCRSPKKETPQKHQGVQAEKKTAAAPGPARVKVKVNKSALGMFKPALPTQFISKASPVTEEKIALGRMLYFEKRLSKNHDVSCNSCHGLNSFGVDNQKTSPGHKGQLGGRNSPTVYNAAGHFVQFWDGRSPDVEDQATGPIMNPVEMAMPDEKRVVDTLASMPEYVAAFKKAFPDEKEAISLANTGKAIGAFERGLVTPSPWDAFLGGSRKALSDEEKTGFNLFVSTGCSTCHNGTLLGGGAYQKLGAVSPWPNQKDQGRFEVTKKVTDKMLFKVPSLRNIEKTSPYFHDGSAATLEEAIELMGKHQLGRDLSEKHVASIATWLSSLTGKVPAEYVKEPPLPPSTPKTPAADPQ